MFFCFRSLYKMKEDLIPNLSFHILFWNEAKRMANRQNKSDSLEILSLTTAAWIACSQDLQLSMKNNPGVWMKLNKSCINLFQNAVLSKRYNTLILGKLSISWMNKKKIYFVYFLQHDRCTIYFSLVLFLNLCSLDF